MKQVLVALCTILIFSACAQTPPTTIPPTPTIAPLPTLLPATATPAPTLTPAPQATADPARVVLEQFMQARIERDDRTVLNLLTDALKFELDNNTNTVQPPLLQVSNPCWYRYDILQYTIDSPNKADARIRMYEHFWSGDSGGGLPQSWEQPLTLVETGEGWRVSAIGKLENQRAAPNEPHGQMLSACNGAR